MMQRLGVRAPILLVGGVLVTMSMEPVLTLVMVAVMPFIGLVVWLVTRKGVPMYTYLQHFGILADKFEGGFFGRSE